MRKARRRAFRTVVPSRAALALLVYRVATNGRFGTVSGSRRYSISLPVDLAEAVRARVGPGGFSAYVAEALEQWVAMDKLREIIADFETDNDELTREEVEAARALLRHDHRQAGGAAA